MSTEVSESATRPDGRRLRWTQHRADRRASFVAAGASAIDLHGPEASAEQIAEIAGVSRTVLYRYFRDREDLRQAIADHIVMAVTESVLPKLAISVESTPRDIITAVVDVIADWLDEHPNLYYFLHTRRSGSSLDVIENTLAVQVAALLNVLMMMFGIDEDLAEPGAHGLVGFVEATGSWWLSHRDEMSRERFTEQVSRSIWNFLEGWARLEGLEIDYERPLPIGPSVATKES
jgi:AcrR family transcriptional regulator